MISTFSCCIGNTLAVFEAGFAVNTHGSVVNGFTLCPRRPPSRPLAGSLEPSASLAATDSVAAVAAAVVVVADAAVVLATATSVLSVDAALLYFFGSGPISAGADAIRMNQQKVPRDPRHPYTFKYLSQNGYGAVSALIHISLSGLTMSPHAAVAVFYVSDMVL